MKTELMGQVRTNPKYFSGIAHAGASVDLAVLLIIFHTIHTNRSQHAAYWIFGTSTICNSKFLIPSLGRIFEQLIL